MFGECLYPATTKIKIIVLLLLECGFVVVLLSLVFCQCEAVEGLPPDCHGWVDGEPGEQ